MTKARIAILASGSGSNAEALMNHFSEGPGAEVGEVAWVCTNRRLAGVRTRAQAHGIAESHLPKAAIAEGELLRELSSRHIEWVALAGFLLKVPADVCKAFEHRMVNIHPALLPKYGGMSMYGMQVHRAVHEAKESTSGTTIHWVNEAYDEGDIVFQGEVALQPEDTPEDIAAKVLALEHRHYPAVLEGLIRMAQGTDVRDNTHLKSHS